MAIALWQGSEDSLRVEEKIMYWLANNFAIIGISVVIVLYIGYNIKSYIVYNPNNKRKHIDG